jgi:hypothetical protein
MLLLEIGFGVFAFRKGWRWRVLWPAGAGFVLAVMIGMAAAAGGGSPRDAAPISVLVDVAIVAALGLMAMRAPAARPADRGLPVPADPLARDAA